MSKRFRNLKNSWLLCTLVFALASTPIALNAQQGLDISGRVKDADGPLAGVTVSVKNKRAAASSNTDGIFSLTGISIGDTLTFRLVGYLGQEIPVRDAKFIE